VISNSPFLTRLDCGNFMYEKYGHCKWSDGQKGREEKEWKVNSEDADGVLKSLPW
jgi:hypothetical protein